MGRGEGGRATGRGRVIAVGRVVGGQELNGLFVAFFERGEVAGLHRLGSEGAALRILNGDLTGPIARVLEAVEAGGGGAECRGYGCSADE